MKPQHLPKTLSSNDSVNNQVSLERITSSRNHHNHRIVQISELIQAQVVRVGPLFALATVVGSTAYPTIRVDYDLLKGSGPIRIGDMLVVGPLEYLVAGPRALTASRLTETYDMPARREAALRRAGVVTRVAPTRTFGEITDECDGERFFVHRSQVQGGTLSLGKRVSFQEATTPRGPLAIEVKVA